MRVSKRGMNREQNAGMVCPIFMLLRAVFISAVYIFARVLKRNWENCPKVWWPIVLHLSDTVQKWK